MLPRVLLRARCLAAVQGLPVVATTATQPWHTLQHTAVRFMSSSEDEELPRRYRKGVKWTPREQSFPTGQKGQAKHPLVEGDRERRHRQLPRRYLDSSYSILPTESESELSEGYPELAPEEEDHYLMPEGQVDEYATTDSEGFPSPTIGDDPLDVPDEILEQVTNPRDWWGPGIEKAREELDEDILKVAAQHEAAQGEMDVPTPEMVETRKAMLKDLEDSIEGQLAIPNRPMWPLQGIILSVETKMAMGKRGRTPKTRVLLVLGNGYGAAGFGFGIHEEPEMATKYAMRNARRHMVHVPTYEGGQLYHDLIGQKNNCEIIIRATPPRMAQKGAAVVRTVLDLMGIKNYSAKIVGSKTKNKYTIIQALFDAFHNVRVPEEVARLRGRRMVWANSNRRRVRDVFPRYPKGPRYQPARKRKM